jgi:hypothetical protein
MENEPKEPKTKFYLNLNNERRECLPEDTMAFLPENEEHHYIFLVDSETEDGYTGRYVWRDFIQEGGSAFDDMIKFMMAKGYVVESIDELDEVDMKAYLASHPDKISLPQRELTPRQERFMSYFNYLLLNGHITAEEFLNGTGELHI